MRLTLRTMLAYLDDILEPGDAEELSKKIEESKFASELVHRIRSSTRRLRLGAPNLEGRGMGLDPNTVAEYLDNTLPTDHVPDFEKVCLESDVHLAEVASCHQVLALVLGEPADLDQSIRERVYRIGQPGTDDDAVSEASDADPMAAGLLQDVPTIEGEPPIETLAEKPADMIPDYMKTGSRISLRSLAITLICAFALAAVALRAWHPFDGDHPVFRLFVGGDGQAVVQAPEEALPEEEASANDAPQPPTTGASDQTPENPEEPAPTTKPEKAEAPADPATDVTPPGSIVEPPTAAPAAPKPTDAPPGKAASTGAEKSMPTLADIPAPEEVMPATVPEPASVGRFVSEEQILGRLDRETGSWFRLEYKTLLSVGDRLIVLPTFRPLVHLGNVHMTFSGPTSVELGAETEPDSPSLVFDYGRAILVSEDDHGSRANLRLAGRDGVVALPNAESALALEVRPYLAPGMDPLANAAVTVVGLYATSGQVTWTEAGADEPLAIEAGQVLVLAGDDAPQLLDAATLPDWYDRRDLSELERSASSDLEKHITTDRPISLSLLERTEFRRIEVAVLACRCLSYLDDFEPILGVLNGERHYSYWNGHFDALRSALARSDESAAKVLKTLEKTHAEDAADFFRMLWSYSPEQLESGEAEKLVGYLEHHAMIARVLAKENLMRITGKSLHFRPEETPGQEKNTVARWHRDLEDGLIRHKNPPAKRPEIKKPAKK